MHFSSVGQAFSTMVLLVYAAMFRKKRQRRWFKYIGHTRALQSEPQALRHRKAWHIESPPFWLRDMDVKSLRLTVVSRHHNKEKALEGEALASARAIDDDPDSARGGPWCRARLEKQDKKEVAKVLECSSLSGVSKIAGDGPLKKHLQDVAFGTRAWEPRPASARSKRPSGCEKRKRKNVKYGDPNWDIMKYGSSNPTKSRTDAQNLYNNSRPDRPRR